MFWAYLVLFAVLCLTASAVVYLLNPDLVKERAAGRGAEQDRSHSARSEPAHVRAIVARRARRRTTALVRNRTVQALQILGLIGFAMGMALTTWARLVNRFFSSARCACRPDRGQQVVSSGPDRLVPHPGNNGGLLLLLSIGVALGSWIAIVPMLLIVPFMVRRTLIEERMLASALPGYVGYMQRVRSRIVPGVW